MSKKSARVVLTLLGSAALGAGCSQAPPPPPPADTFTSQIDFEKEPGENGEAQPPGTVAGQAAAAPMADQNSQSLSTGHSSHYYHRGPSLWPMLFWGSTSRGATAYQQGYSSSVPRGPSHVTPPAIPTRGVSRTGLAGTHPTSSHFPTASGTPSHATPSHTTTTHSGSTSHVSSHGFGSTGHAVSGGS